MTDRALFERDLNSLIANQRGLCSFSWVYWFKGIKRLYSVVDITTNHMSSGTRGSSLKKASRHAYRERGSPRVLLGAGAYLKSSGMFSRWWISNLFKSFLDQFIKTIIGEANDARFIGFSSSDKSMHSSFSSSNWRCITGDVVVSESLSVSLESFSSLLLEFRRVKDWCPSCCTKGASMVRTIMWISVPVTVWSHVIGVMRGVPYGFHTVELLLFPGSLQRMKLNHLMQEENDKQNIHGTVNGKKII